MENALVRFFKSFRELVEAAETPFAKLATLILPLLSPAVPAAFTALHIFKLVENVFDLPAWISVALAVIVGAVLELLGFVGAIEFIHSIFRLVRNADKEAYWLPVILTGVAYLFYLVAMFLTNVQLGRFFGTAPIINSIVGLLAFITVPTGLLLANHLASKEESELDNVLRQEQREDKLKAKAIKAGINVFAPTVLNSDTPQVRTKHASDFKDYAFELLDEAWKNGRVLTPRDLTTIVSKNKRVSLDHNKCKGTWTNFTKEWKRSRGL